MSDYPHKSHNYILLKAAASLPTTMGFMSNAILHFSKLSDFAILEIPLVFFKGLQEIQGGKNTIHTTRYTNDKIWGSNKIHHFCHLQKVGHIFKLYGTCATVAVYFSQRCAPKNNSQGPNTGSKGVTALQSATLAK